MFTLTLVIEHHLSDVKEFCSLFELYLKFFSLFLYL
nr:MAG TPA: hypothetical protein [Ackermannviridae sp.]